MSESVPRHSSFIVRLLWWLAMLSLISGVVNVTSTLVNMIHLGVLSAWGSGRLQTEMRLIAIAFFAVHLGAAILLVLGGSGLLFLKRWAWYCLFIAGCMYIPLAGCGAIGDFAGYYDYVSLNPDSGISLKVQGWRAFASFVSSSTFPAVLLAVLWQREVRKLWHRGGFEVIPAAQLAENDRLSP